MSAAGAVKPKTGVYGDTYIQGTLLFDVKAAHGNRPARVTDILVDRTECQGQGHFLSQRFTIARDGSFGGDVSTVSPEPALHVEGQFLSKKKAHIRVEQYEGMSSSPCDIVDVVAKRR